MPETILKRRPFGSTGLEVTPLGFGGAEIGYLEADDDQVRGVLDRALDLGVNVIDTAACYRGSEAAIGRAVAERRDEFVLISKCGHGVEGDDRPTFSKSLIAGSIDRSLRRLQTEVIDVMLLHSCGLDRLEGGEPIEALLDAKRAGKVRFVGYSGDNEPAAWAADHAEFDVIETSINLADQANIDRVLPKCREAGKGVIVKRPVANACWRSRDEQRGVYKDYASEYARRFAAMGLDAGELGFEAGDWPQIALRFALAQPGVDTLIVGTTNPDHLRQNVAFAAAGPLLDAAVARIREAFVTARDADPGGDWAGQV